MSSSQTFSCIHQYIPKVLTCIVYEYLLGNETSCCQAASLGVAEFIDKPFWYLISRYGYLELIRDMMSDWGIDNQCKIHAVIGAIEGEHIDVLQLLSQTCQQMGWNSIMMLAVKWGYKSIVLFAINNGADAIEEALTKAMENGHQDITKLLANQYRRSNNQRWFL